MIDDNALSAFAANSARGGLAGMWQGGSHSKWPDDAKMTDGVTLSATLCGRKELHHMSIMLALLLELPAPSFEPFWPRRARWGSRDGSPRLSGSSRESLSAWREVRFDDKMRYGAVWTVGAGWSWVGWGGVVRRGR